MGWNFTTSFPYITSSYMSAQLNSVLKQQQWFRETAAILSVSSAARCWCYCVRARSKILILLMCCGLQCQYNCSARCHLISSSCLPDTSASLKSLYSSELWHDLIISAIVLLSSAEHSTSISCKKSLPVKKYDTDLIKRKSTEMCLFAFLRRCS